MQATDSEFSFETQSNQAKSPRFFNGAAYQQNLLQQSPLNFNLYPQKDPAVCLLQVIPTQSIHLSKQLKEAYGASLKVKGTLYEGILVALLHHLHCDDKEHPGFIEWTTMVFSDSLKQHLFKGITLPDPYQRLDQSSLKVCLANTLKDLRQSRDRLGRHQLHTCLLQVFNSHPVSFLGLSISLRALVGSLNEKHSMGLEPYSTESLTDEPEADILWLLSDFFDVDIRLLCLKEGMLREDTFKSNVSANGIVYLVQQQGSYLFLKPGAWSPPKDAREMELENTDLLVPQPDNAATLHQTPPKAVQKQPGQAESFPSPSVLQFVEQPKNPKGIQVTGHEQEGVKTERKQRKKRSHNRTRLRFQQQLGEIRDNTSRVFQKGQLLISKVQNLMELQSPHSRLQISGTLSISLSPQGRPK